MPINGSFLVVLVKTLLLAGMVALAYNLKPLRRLREEDGKFQTSPSNLGASSENKIIKIIGV